MSFAFSSLSAQKIVCCCLPPAAGPAVPSQTPAPSGCALTFVQSNSSYSMFNDIINSAPQSANFSSARPLIFLFLHRKLTC